MSLAKEINERLDEILNIRAEIRRMNEDIADDQVLKNVTNGESTDKAGALRVVEAMIDQIKSDLNQITNNGQNVIDVFTNKYYIHDTMQDREIIKNQK
jgi:hypothetical protein